MARYLVTGGAGFIGSNLVAALVAAGEEVHVLDDLSTGHESNLAPYARQIKLFVGDLCDASLLKQALQGVDYVLHHAAMASVPQSINAPLEAHRVNVTGTLQLLEISRQQGVRRVVLAASSAIYGDSQQLPLAEETPPRPISPYAATKLMGEYYATLYSHCFGLETVSLRYFNVFGPRQDPHSQYAAVIPCFVDALLRNEPPIIFGDGQQTRDFTYIDNVVQANLAACRAANVAGQVFNIASGRRISLLQLLDVLQHLLGTHSQPQMAPARPGDILHSEADIRRARQDLGYNPPDNFVSGMQQTLAWYQQTQTTPRNP